MKLIAKRPCSFGGRNFYIGDEIPESLVTDAGRQEKLGIISIVNDSAEASGSQSDALFTQVQVDSMVDEAVSEAVAKMQQKQEELQQAVAELKETEPGAFESTVQISLKGEADGENEQVTVIPATPEEIQLAFSIMQLNAEEGAKAIADVQSENVLILLHAADSRKTIKEAAIKQADNLFSNDGKTNESTDGNATTGTNTEGADT